jgi:hypothetical protein
MTLVPLPRRVGPIAPPPFCPAEGGIDEGLGQIELAACQQILGQLVQHFVQHPFVHPALEATVAGLVWWKFALRQFPPLCPGSQNPQHPFQHGTSFFPRPSAALGWRFGFD